MSSKLDLVVIGLSLSSSWGNGHATTYRALLKAFAARGHRILFLEQDVPWYTAHRDLASPDFCELDFYRDRADLARFTARISSADAVLVGSYVQDGIEVGRWVQEVARGVTAFYDIDTPVTLAALDAGRCAYLSHGVIPAYDVYFSFTGGPTLQRLEQVYGSPCALPLYCSVDPEAYMPVETPRLYELGYLGTYSVDRQPTLERLLIEPARLLPHRRFVVAGPQYPDNIAWPENVVRIDHVAPKDHAAFYAACRYTLNVTRSDMIAAGYSPSVRLFEAAACGAPIISDVWKGIEEVLAPGREIILAQGAGDVVACLTEANDRRRDSVAAMARQKILGAHTSAHRAAELEAGLLGAMQAAKPVDAAAG
jgi:spore maturation protein CgeB